MTTVPSSDTGSRTARAIVLEAAGEPFAISEIELDEPRAGEILVRIVAAGVCHTDLLMQAGAIPFATPGVLGHEGAGVVEAIGPGVQRVVPGDKVLLSFTSCGGCANCRDGHPAYCVDFFARNFLSGTRPDGSPTIRRGADALSGGFFGQSSFAGRALASERSAVRLPPEITEDELAGLAPLGCGVQTGIGGVWNILRPRVGTTLAVLGVGAVGLSAIFAASQLPLARIIAVDLHPSRLELARAFGADEVIDAGTQDVSARLGELTGGAGLDYAIETTGVPDVLASTVLALGPRGVVGQIGGPSVPGATAPIGVQDLLVGKTIVGIPEGDSEPQTLLPVIAGHVLSGRFPLARAVRFYAPEQINDAVADMHSGETVKPVIRF